MGINTGSKDFKEKYKEMEEWKKISEEEISNEFQKQIEIFFNKGITEYIVGEFTRLLSECMVNSFDVAFNNIDNYMVEKTGKQVKIISDKIIELIKGN